MNGIAVALLWFGGLALHGLAWPMTPPVRAAIALLALAAFAALHARAPDGAGIWLRRGLVLAGIGAAWALLPASPTLRGPLYALATVALGAPTGASAALLAATLLTTLAPWLPGLAPLGEAAAGMLHREPAGPSAVGLPGLLWAALCLAPRVRALTPARLATVLALALAALPLAQPLAAIWHARVGAYSGAEHAGHDHPIGLFARLPFALVLLGTAVAIAWQGAVASDACAQVSRWRRVARLGAAAVAGVALALLLAGWRAPGAPDRRLAVLNVGGIDWDRPNWETFGAYSGGMFGLLPAYLQDAGWSVQALAEQDLDGFGVDRARVLLLINCHREWSAAERTRIEDFLRAGGSLLVLGDHTDVFGLMRGFNPLTTPWGVTFRYDSAYHTGAGWADDVAWLPGALGAWRDPRAANVGIGASLALRPPARPLLTARYAFSDLGEPENLMGSFLGNYAHDPGERVGDLALIAGVRIGRGRAIVYGDTSGFQNGSLPTTMASHVGPLLETLARPDRFAIPHALESALAWLAAAATVFALLRASAGGRRALLTAGAGFALGITIAPGGENAGATLERADLDRALLLDLSALPEIGHYDADWNSPGPLESCALRSDLRVWHLARWDSAAVRRAAATVLIGPRVALGADRLADLAAACANGATVIVAASGGDDAGVAALLERHGVRIAPTHLGPIPPPGRQAEHEPRFTDASPLVIAAGVAVEEIYRYGEHRIAVAVPAGTGRLIVIGDTRFFSAANVEGTWGWWGGNLRLLHDLLARYCAGATTVAPLLPPPTKPPEDA
jgi:hypothetical protein